MTSPNHLEEAVEKLSREFHAIYQKEARRQAGTGDDEVRHPDDYDALEEHTKEYDRVLARYVLNLIQAEVRKAVRQKEKVIRELEQYIKEENVRHN